MLELVDAAFDQMRFAIQPGIAAVRDLGALMRRDDRFAAALLRRCDERRSRIRQKDADLAILDAPRVPLYWRLTPTDLTPWMRKPVSSTTRIAYGSPRCARIRRAAHRAPHPLARLQARKARSSPLRSLIQVDVPPLRNGGCHFASHDLPHPGFRPSSTYPIVKCNCNTSTLLGGLTNYIDTPHRLKPSRILATGGEASCAGWALMLPELLYATGLPGLNHPDDSETV